MSARGPWRRRGFRAPSPLQWHVFLTSQIFLTIMIFVTINIPYYHTLTAARISSTQSFAVAASEKRSSTRLPLSQISNTCEHHDEQLIVRNI